MANELNQQYPVACNNPERVIQAFKLSFGAAGAVGSISQGGSGWTFTKGGTGVYNFTFPKCIGVVLTFGLFTSTTAQKVVLTALNESAGTGTVVLAAAGGAGGADPGSGDQLNVIAFFKFKGVD